jgi:hypothetical protein
MLLRFVALLVVLLWAAEAPAARIIPNRGGFSRLTTSAQFFTNQGSEHISPPWVAPWPEFPWQRTSTISRNLASATADYDFDDQLLHMDFDLSIPWHPNPIVNSDVDAQGSIYFEVSSDVEYALSASLSVTGERGPTSRISARLADISNGVVLYNGATASDSFDPQLEIGDTGSQGWRGTLVAGNYYRLSWEASIHNRGSSRYGGNAAIGASGTGDLDFRIAPEPSSALLVGIGLVAIAAKRRQSRTSRASPMRASPGSTTFA